MWSRCDNWKIESFEATHFAGFWNVLPAPKKTAGFDIAVRGLGIQGIRQSLVTSCHLVPSKLGIPKNCGGYRVNKINHFEGILGP